MMTTKPVFGAGLSAALADAGTLLDNAARLDAAGLDLVSLSDHPYFADRLDAYAALGMVLGRTRALGGLVSVTNLPSRPAPMLARTVSTLAAVSGGRLVLGMGAGGLWDDIARLGAPRRSPGEAVRAMGEAITLVRMLCGGGDPVTFDGEFYQVTELEPAPVAAPPVWTGAVGPRSLAVTGRLADGWVPGHAADWRSDRYARSRPVIDEAAAAAGRDPSAVATVYNLPGAITAGPLPATRDEHGHWLGGSVRQWTEELTSAVREHGAAGFVYFPADHGAPALDALDRWAGEIVPAVREAVG